MQKYQIKHYDNPEFWKELEEVETREKDYPAVVQMGEKFRLLYAPLQVLQDYLRFKDPGLVFSLVVPKTPAPISEVLFLAGPQHGQERRFYVIFMYAPGQAVVAPCSLFPLLHRPMSLRVDGSDAVHKAFKTSYIILKGDDVPINIVMQSAQNPSIGLRITEREASDGTHVLDININMPAAACMTINHDPVI